jgi:hypothetical protein
MVVAHGDKHKATDISWACPSSIAAKDNNPVQNLDELCSPMVWNANTGAIFEKIDLPLVDTSLSLEAAGGDIVFLVSEDCAKTE